MDAPDVELSEFKACVAAVAADAADSAACTMRNASSAPSIPGTAGADAVGLPSATGLPAALIAKSLEQVLDFPAVTPTAKWLDSHPNAKA